MVADVCGRRTKKCVNYDIRENLIEFVSEIGCSVGNRIERACSP